MLIWFKISYIVNDLKKKNLPIDVDFFLLSGPPHPVLVALPLNNMYSRSGSAAKLVRFVNRYLH